MSIKSISLQNFQSHLRTHLEFSDGYNVIYGPSDNGKSSIIRGINWVVQNRPSGDGFRSHETRKTSCTIESENFIVEHRRTDTKNEYEMDEEIYKALHTTVPEDISVALNLSEVNIQPQHETYFLIDKSPGQRSKKLNEVAGLQIMDEVLKKVNSEVRAVDSTINIINSKLQEDKNGILDLDWVNNADKFLIKLEEYHIKLGQLKEKYTTITNILQQYQQLKTQKGKFLSNECTKKIAEFVKENNLIKKERNQYVIISKSVNKINELQKQLKAIVIINISALQKQCRMLDSKQNKYKLILDITNQIKTQQTACIDINSELIKTRQKITTELKRLGICPTCGKTI